MTIADILSQPPGAVAVIDLRARVSRVYKPVVRNTNQGPTPKVDFELEDATAKVRATCWGQENAGVETLLPLAVGQQVTISAVQGAKGWGGARTRQAAAYGQSPAYVELVVWPSCIAFDVVAPPAQAQSTPGPSRSHETGYRETVIVPGPPPLPTTVWQPPTSPIPMGGQHTAPPQPPPITATPPMIVIPQALTEEALLAFCQRANYAIYRALRVPLSAPVADESDELWQPPSAEAMASVLCTLCIALTQGRFTLSAGDDGGAEGRPPF